MMTILKSEMFQTSHLIFRGDAVAGKTGKTAVLPWSGRSVNPISSRRGANYAHHITAGLTWLKFSAATLNYLLAFTPKKSYK